MDLRVPIALCLGAMGTPITVTRPVLDDGPVTTSGIWISPLVDERPFGTDVQRREPRRVMAIPRDALVMTQMPRGTQVLAAEEPGAVVRTWRVDALDSTEVDCFRVILVPVSEI